MNVKVEKAGGLTRFSIEGDMTIYHAGELKKSIFENLQGAEPSQGVEPLQGAEAVEFDLNAVSDMDTAGVQLLMLALREAKACRKSVKIAAHSNATKKIFDLYNLNGYF
ncbi:MAG: STAS domain-containing protein [Deltaproteobacteria bacterium]|nr:STAS domain-containing protein [Deltaproteobacteria bacterium]